MKQIVAAGTIKAGHTDMVMSFHPAELGWHPQPDPRAEVDEDERRKLRVETELAYGDLPNSREWSSIGLMPEN